MMEVQTDDHVHPYNFAEVRPVLDDVVNLVVVPESYVAFVHDGFYTRGHLANSLDQLVDFLDLKRLISLITFWQLIKLHKG